VSSSDSTRAGSLVCCVHPNKLDVIIVRLYLTEVQADGMFRVLQRFYNDFSFHKTPLGLMLLPGTEPQRGIIW
jgi:hypothetical protein